jgi:hypothetical protein
MQSVRTIRTFYDTTIKVIIGDRSINKNTRCIDTNYTSYLFSNEKQANEFYAEELNKHYQIQKIYIHTNIVEVFNDQFNMHKEYEDAKQNNVV